MEQSIDTRERTTGTDRMAGPSYPIEFARRAIAAQAVPEPQPLDDPWFIDEEPVRTAEDDSSYESWVDQMESWVPPPPSVPARSASPR